VRHVPALTRPAEIAEHLVAELIEEGEPQDQAIKNLLIHRLALVTGETLAKAPHRVSEEVSRAS
jgi:hypothetical protein